MRSAAAAVLAAVLLTGCTRTGEVGVEETPPAWAQAPAVEPTATVPRTTEPAVDLPRRPRPRRAEVRAEPVADLDGPTALTVRPGDDWLYVAERGGRIVAVSPSGEVETVVDLKPQVNRGHEQGMLGLVFSPDGEHLYVSYIGQDDDHSHLDVLRMDGREADPDSRQQVLLQEQPEGSTVHKGGQLAFGPDGYLYLSLGDGGPVDPAPDTPQRLDTLLGKIVRIDPRPGAEPAYEIPPDNPFAGRDDALPEIFALGLRNPWRFSFDGNRIWIADVGRYVQEEINSLPLRKAAGANFGWPALEGEVQHAAAPEGAVAPLATYPHDDRCAIIGGYVYRGTAVPDLHGAYVYGDFCDGEVRALERRKREVGREANLGVDVAGMSSFGVDADGELYVMSLEEGLLKLVPDEG